MSVAHFSLFSMRGARNLRCVARFLILLLFLHGGAAEVQAQNGNSPGEKIEREWQAGERDLKAEKFDAAIAHFTRVITLLQQPEVPTEARVLANAFASRADAHYGAEHWKSAVADYSRCIELDPKNAGAYAYRGVARKAANGDYDGFIADVAIAAKLDPEYEYLLEDANSTVLWRRARLGFLLLGAFVVAIGAFPLVRSLTRLIKAGG